MTRAQEDQEIDALQVAILRHHAFRGLLAKVDTVNLLALPSAPVLVLAA
jgi:hypothetical protein